MPLIATLAVTAVLALLIYGIAASGSGSLQIGDEAPDRELPTLDGEATGSLADHRGKWVFVNFWASWCEPCRTESPELQRFHDEHSGEGFTVLGINTEDATDDALAFRDEFDLTFPMLRDAEGERRDAWAMTGLPENFLVDPEGNLAYIRRGPVTGELLERFVEPLIAPKAREEER